MCHFVSFKHFILLRIILRTFGSEINGLCSSIGQFLSYITLAEAGIGGVARSKLYKILANKDKDKLNSLVSEFERFFRILAIVFVAYVVVLAFIYPFITQNSGFDYLFTFSMVLIIALATFSQYFFGISHQVILQSDQKTYISQSFQIGGLILNFVVSIILIYLGCPIYIVKLASAIIFVIRPILLRIYVKKKYDIKKVLFNKENRQLTQKKDALVQHIAYYLHSNIDVVIITFFLTLSDVSVYSVYYTIIGGMKIISMAFNSGIEAALGNMIAKDDIQRLSKNFDIIELIGNIITIVIFTATAILITPFIRLYTANIVDVNYVVPLLGAFLILSEAMYCIRLPYNNLMVGAGKFKETKVGAYLEAGINIVLSLVFIVWLGVWGVALATFIAMCFRTVELGIKMSRIVLQRKVSKLFIRLLVSAVSAVIPILIFYFIPMVAISNYLIWIIYAIVVTIVTTIITILINLLFYNKTFKDMFVVFKNIFKKKGKANED